MKLAVVRVSGKQHLVSAGQKLIVDRLEGKPKDKLSLKEVLLIIDDKKIEVGKPLVKEAKVEAEIVAQTKAKKIRVMRFKAKSRYRRAKGHRQQKTELKIVKV